MKAVEAGKYKLAAQAAQLQDNFINTFGSDLFISEATPVLWLGRSYQRSTITVGINPSPRDFLDQQGNTLTGEKQRFTTKSAEETMEEWLKQRKNYEEMTSCFEEYFERSTVYTSWFGKQYGGKLEGFMNAWGLSFYRPEDKLLHMDFLPLVTKQAAGKVKRKNEMLDHSAAYSLFAARVDHLLPEKLIFLGGEFSSIITPRNGDNTWRYITRFPSAAYKIGTFQNIPAVVLAFKPSEQFLGLGGKEDVHGQSHGFYGRKESLQFIGSAISREMAEYTIE